MATVGVDNPYARVYAALRAANSLGGRPGIRPMPYQGPPGAGAGNRPPRNWFGGPPQPVQGPPGAGYGFNQIGPPPFGTPSPVAPPYGIGLGHPGMGISGGVPGPVGGPGYGTQPGWGQNPPPGWNQRPGGQWDYGVQGTPAPGQGITQNPDGSWSWQGYSWAGPAGTRPNTDLTQEIWNAGPGQQTSAGPSYWRRP